MGKVYIEGLGTQPADIQRSLEAQVDALKQADLEKNNLVRLVVKGLIYVGRVYLFGRRRRFRIEKCEHAPTTSTAAQAPAEQPAPKKAAKRKPAKRSK